MAIDYATSWPVTKAIPDTMEEMVTEFLHEIYVTYRAPQELLSDNGKSFIAGAIQLYICILETKHQTTTPYHPQMNGKVENLNGTLGSMLTKALMGKPTKLWDEYLS
jgi:transposase InsO family protein